MALDHVAIKTELKVKMLLGTDLKISRKPLISCSVYCSINSSGS